MGWEVYLCFWEVRGVAQLIETDKRVGLFREEMCGTLLQLAECKWRVPPSLQSRELMRRSHRACVTRSETLF